YALPWVKAVAALAPRSLRAAVGSRSEPGIPPDRVRCLWATTALERLRHRLGLSATLTYLKLDRRFSEAAAHRAAKQRSHLFLYTPYAWEAFRARSPHRPRRVLFQYHPHPETENRLLAEDAVQYPDVGESFGGVTGGPLPEELVRRERDCWRFADEIICASE